MGKTSQALKGPGSDLAAIAGNDGRWKCPSGRTCICGLKRAVWRSGLAAPPSSAGWKGIDTLWVNRLHEALEVRRCQTPHELHRPFCWDPISVHGFRHSIAMAIMARDPGRGIVAAGTLGHKGLRTLTEYYAQIWRCTRSQRMGKDKKGSPAARMSLWRTIPVLAAPVLCPAPSDPMTAPDPSRPQTGPSGNPRTGRSGKFGAGSTASITVTQWRGTASASRRKWRTPPGSAGIAPNTPGPRA